MKENVEIELLTNLIADGERHQKGDVLEVSPELAAELIAAGSARIPVLAVEAEDENALLRAALDELRAESTGLQEELDDTRGELNAVQAAVIGKSDEVRKLEKELHTVKTQHAADKAEITRLKNEIQTMQRKAIGTAPAATEPATGAASGKTQE